MADSKKTGKLEKLLIRSFKNKDFTGEQPSKKFETPINPETFTKTSHIELDMGKGHGKSGTNPKYKSTAPEEVKIEFILDGTNSLEGYLDEYNKIEVTEQIKKFNDCVYNIESDTHRPYFLIVHWGSDLSFNCILSHLDISYSLFKSNGNPLRAKLTATFVKYETPKTTAAKARTASPDLTHYRTSKAGDRLDLMTFKIYNDSNYFMQVAKANGLSNLRTLKPASEIYFPPFEKNES